MSDFGYETEAKVRTMILCCDQFDRGDTISSQAQLVETLVIGQGLAGTAVAWELERRGESYLVVDPGLWPTSSQVAAGLITPVTGKRLTIAPHYDELCVLAKTFYKTIEKRLKSHFFLDQPALRLCYSAEEAQQFEVRADALIKSGHAERYATNSDSSYRACQLAFVMPQAARLETQIYLDRSRHYFTSSGKQICKQLDVNSLQIVDGQACFPSDSLRARRVIFCGGYQDQSNPWLPQGLFDCAKGEILKVRIEGFEERRTVHANMSWLCPTADPSSYLFGATYSHGEYEYKTTVAAKEELTQRLAGIVATPFEVTGQQFGIRPVGPDRRAILGRHATHPCLFWLNGLASKGALHGPYLAARLVEGMLGEDEFDVQLTAAHVSN